MNKIKVTDQDLKGLKALDPILSKYIEENEKPVRYYADSFFISVVETLIGQLISAKSSTTIYNQLEKVLKVVSIDTFLSASEKDIIDCGVYKKKYDQIYYIANNLKNGILDYHHLMNKSDSEVVEILCKYPGIGLWSAEMIMMHGMRHPDILAYGDFGVRSGIKKIYGLTTLSKSEFNQIQKRLSPYGTIASLYFWQAHQKE